MTSRRVRIVRVARVPTGESKMDIYTSNVHVQVHDVLPGMWKRERASRGRVPVLSGLWLVEVLMVVAPTGRGIDVEE